ncbi:AbiV family abortive infection protein [Mycolicibacterium sp. 120270]|uniref:AbiV family abortive infection protein n=1 Tax=Mycolicibacterium sp. 120270 TaxID=3090600 RepID=UPI00299D43B6|nr:AbiV family abortive infection protein [Mycolicibacterium sp. 120270]MDX1883041.1 AbiV family abortive infection protein [Mycolicibacterium sp. 120270]
MMGRVTLRLSVANSRAYWRALMRNAVSLLEDAKLLLDNDSSGRAQSLIILAQEELARANALYKSAVEVWEQGVGFVELPPQIDPTTDKSKPHLTVSKNHLDKIEHSERYGIYLSAFWGHYTEVGEQRDANDVNEAKQAGFYVAATPGEGGVFASPLDIPADVVADELEQVAGVVEMALIQDHTRMQALEPGDHDWTHDLQTPLLRLAHPDDWKFHQWEGNQSE